ncbi:MAG: hypothetical protein JRJ51_03535 [Deltaproteobacteria bacterium]|nr:hypothetical protein [Deltaproteobacteria bacterium]MBW1941889.1 hypothetical protein [Deltaproteobacteria bacterium]
MSEKEQLKALVKEAEIYHSQGLLDQALEKYHDILEFVEGHERLSKDEKLVEAVNRKIQTVEGKLAEIEAADDKPELSEDVQSLIGKLFAFSKSKDRAAIEAGIALAKFGQYEKAVEEFQRLIKEGILPLQAAMNLMRCHLTLSSPDGAINEFKRWVSRNVFSTGDLKYLRKFLENALSKKGIQADLPQIEGGKPAKERPAEKEEAEEEEILALSSVTITLPEGPRKGESEEFEVNFQSGNAISIIISSKEKDLSTAFENGQALTNIQCFSSMGVFNSNGIVSGKALISSGPKKGDFAVDITIHEE